MPIGTWLSSTNDYNSSKSQAMMFNGVAIFVYTANSAKVKKKYPPRISVLRKECTGLNNILIAISSQHLKYAYIQCF